MAHPLPVGCRLGCHVLCVLERTGCHGVSEPSGAAHVDGKVTKAPFGHADAACWTERWSLRTPSRKISCNLNVDHMRTNGEDENQRSSSVYSD